MMMNDNCLAEVDGSTASTEVSDPVQNSPQPVASNLEDPLSVPWLRRLQAYSTRPTKWVWEGLIPQGKLTFVTGESGVGKSWFALQAVAMVTRGRRMPDLVSPGDSADIRSAETNGVDENAQA